MKMAMKSMLTGNIHTRDIDVSYEQLDAWVADGTSIQDALPHLSADDREFIKTGITPEEWSEL